MRRSGEPDLRAPETAALFCWSHPVSQRHPKNPDRGHRFTPRSFAGNPNAVVAYPPYLMGQYCGYALAYLVAPTLARISREADRSAGLRDDRNNLARGSARTANAVHATGAPAQRG